MKKISILAVSFALIFAGACTKEQTNTVPSEGPNPEPLTFGVTYAADEESDDAKVKFNGGSPQWEGNESISVISTSDKFTDIYTAKFTNSAGKVQSTANFSGSITKGGRYFFLYPYQKSATVNNYSTGKYSGVTIPNVQYPVKSGFDSAADLMRGSSYNQGGELTLQHVCGFLELKIGTGSKWSRIEVTSIDESIPTCGEVTVTNGGTVGKTDNSKNCIVVYPAGSAEGSRTTFEAGTYRVAIRPVEYTKGLRISFYVNNDAYKGTDDKDGFECKYVRLMSGKITFAPGKSKSIKSSGSIVAVDNTSIGNIKAPYCTLTKINGEDYETVMGGNKYLVLPEGASNLVITYESNCSNIIMHKQGGCIPESFERTTDPVKKTVTVPYGDEAFYASFHIRSRERGDGLGHNLGTTGRFYHPGVIRLAATTALQKGATGWSIENELKTDGLKFSYGITDFSIKATFDFKAWPKKTPTHLHLVMGQYVDGDWKAAPGYFFLPKLSSTITYEGSSGETITQVVGLKPYKIELVSVTTSGGTSKVNATVYEGEDASSTTTPVSDKVRVTTDGATATWNIGTVGGEPVTISRNKYYRLQAIKPSANGENCFTKEIDIYYEPDIVN